MESKKLSDIDNYELLRWTNEVIKSAQEMQYHILTGEWKTAHADGKQLSIQTGYIRNFCTQFLDMTQP